MNPESAKELVAEALPCNCIFRDGHVPGCWFNARPAVESLVTRLLADKERLREALQWAMPRLNADSLIREGMGRYPDKYDEVHDLAYGGRP